MYDITVNEFGVQYKKVVLLIGGWTYKQGLLAPTARRLSLAGYRVVVVTYGNDVLTPDVYKTVDYIYAIKQAILDQITKLKAQDCQEFALFGTSLGTVIGCLVANEIPQITKVILNTAGADMGKTIWSWDTLRPWFKQRVADQGYTQKTLSEAWRPISPLYHIDTFGTKQVLVYLATHDESIPYTQGLELADALKKTGAETHVVRNKRLGHGLAGVANLLRFKRYLAFLKK